MKKSDKENANPNSGQQQQKEKLNSSFEDLTIEKGAPAKPVNKKFAYEPALFPNRAVKQLTGKNWHDLSPLSKK